MLTADDHRRIEEAVGKAEAGSSGDIFCVLAGEVSSYRETPIAWAAAVALLAPPLVLAVGLGPLLTAITAGGWTAAQASALPGEVAFALTGYAVVQAALFALVALIVIQPAVRRALTPRFLKRHRVKKAAFHHFAAAHSHAAESDACILIFVALVERQVQVLADAPIHARCGEALWDKVAAAVQDGMKSADPTAGIERAIALCGDALKAHFPSDRRGTGVDKPMEV
jgi:putative membrane protein